MTAAFRAMALTVGLLVGPPALADELNRSPLSALPSTERAQTAEQKRELLKDLLSRLTKAKNAESATLLATAIEELWLRSDSDTVDLLMQRAMTSVRDSDLELALQLLNHIVALKPSYAEGWNKRATVLYMMEDYQRALGDLQRALALEPSHFGAMNGVGLIMRELGDDGAALAAFRKALRIHPNLQDAKRIVRELEREVEGQGI